MYLMFITEGKSVIISLLLDLELLNIEPKTPPIQRETFHMPFIILVVLWILAGSLFVISSYKLL
jgi:hypothetical protein